MTVAAGVKTVASRSVISDFEDLVPGRLITAAHAA